ncbi:hypothetical protein OGAPHI_003578 [Ogataea philodendri]|uniref:Uncharacterized protein n=1 Tax=Ogataea philodendri TaxID=1378263 RepID=A0A9P8P5L1_9ASCO|nr:uncharacterized protein OGAPHI_003578 [Ogataea philodendri]KAH3665394.1 hypothetical protein OGAPHI_003578 [Ogataea philodendri]
MNPIPRIPNVLRWKDYLSSAVDTFFIAFLEPLKLDVPGEFNSDVKDELGDIKPEVTKYGVERPFTPDISGVAADVSNLTEGFRFVEFREVGVVELFWN